MKSAPMFGGEFVNQVTKKWILIFFIKYRIELIVK